MSPWVPPTKFLKRELCVLICKYLHVYIYILYQIFCQFLKQNKNYILFFKSISNQKVFLVDRAMLTKYYSFVPTKKQIFFLFFLKSSSLEIKKTFYEIFSSIEQFSFFFVFLLFVLILALFPLTNSNDRIKINK